MRTRLSKARKTIRQSPMIRTMGGSRNSAKQSTARLSVHSELTVNTIRRNRNSGYYNTVAASARTVRLSGRWGGGGGGGWEGAFCKTKHYSAKINTISGNRNSAK